LQATVTITGYDSFEQIALGGMATVYKARKISLDMPVAIKVLFPHLAQDSVYIERFKREARAAARVQHDSIVNVIDYGESEGSHYIVMEYYDGETLEELLLSQKAIPLDICFAVLLNVCYGLEEAHAANLIHRDIKPANIIFTRNGSVKIADFGLAKATDTMKSVTQHGNILGTPAYMSPEQTLGEEVSPQSDIFSLGVVAYELATGRRPFDGNNYAEVVDRIQREDPEPVQRLNPLVEDSFAAIIGRMLARDPDTRYKNVSDVVTALDGAIYEAGYKRDRRVLGEYIRDPQAYLTAFNTSLLDILRASVPGPEVGRVATVLYYRRILHIDPDNKAAREALSRIPAGTGSVEQAADPEPPRADPAPPKNESTEVQYDPDADYRVYLDAIDPAREAPPSFALKLSMRIQSPLPRVMAVVKNMPAVVAGRLSIDRAKKLANVIRDLGGIARIEVHPVNESTGDHKPAPKPAPEVPPANNAGEASGGKSSSGRRERDGADTSKTTEHKPITTRPAGNQVGRARSAERSTRGCPKCGWEEDADAKFCSVCRFNFNKTEPLTLTDLQKNLGADNPLSEGVDTGFDPLSVLKNLPAAVKYGGLAGLIVLVLLIVFGR
jgi:serine/threonine-protein kinase